MRSFGGPYPGPYAYPYPGPTRPYPELPEARGGVASARMPRAALAAGVVGILGVFPLVFLSVVVLVLGRGVTTVEWWLYLLPVAPALEFAGAVWLLARRGWLLPVLSFVPAAGIFLALLVSRLLGDGDLGLGWYVPGFCLPLVALALTPLPSVRAWVRTRPRVRRVPAR